MNGLRKILIPLLVTIVLVSLAIVSEKLYFTDFEYHFRTKVFNRVLAEKVAFMDQCLEDMKPILA